MSFLPLKSDFYDLAKGAFNHFAAFVFAFAQSACVVTYLGFMLTGVVVLGPLDLGIIIFLACLLFEYNFRSTMFSLLSRDSASATPPNEEHSRAYPQPPFQVALSKKLLMPLCVGLIAMTITAGFFMPLHALMAHILLELGIISPFMPYFLATLACIGGLYLMYWLSRQRIGKVLGKTNALMNIPIGLGVYFVGFNATMFYFHMTLALPFLPTLLLSLLFAGSAAINSWAITASFMEDTYNKLVADPAGFFWEHPLSATLSIFAAVGLVVWQAQGAFHAMVPWGLHPVLLYFMFAAVIVLTFMACFLGFQASLANIEGKFKDSKRHQAFLWQQGLQAILVTCIMLTCMLALDGATMGFGYLLPVAFAIVLIAITRKLIMKHCHVDGDVVYSLQGKPANFLERWANHNKRESRLAKLLDDMLNQYNPLPYLASNAYGVLYGLVSGAAIMGTLGFVGLPAIIFVSVWTALFYALMMPMAESCNHMIPPNSGSASKVSGCAPVPYSASTNFGAENNSPVRRETDSSRITTGDKRP